MVFLWVSWAILVTSLHLGGVCSASPGRRVVEVEVEFGGEVVLPCNGSAYLPEGSQREQSEGEFRWEAMGADVASLEEGEVNEGRGYQGRVSLAPEDERRQGDWSLVLHSVLLSDSDMYECIWDNRITVTTVFVKVKEPSPERTMSAAWGQAVRLPCYGDVPKNLRSDELYVQWLRDGREVALLDQDHIVIDDEEPGRLTLWPSEPLGEFALIISPVAPRDHGLYHCFYKTRSFEEAKPGIPESILLTVEVGGDTETAPVTGTQAETRTEVGAVTEPSPVTLGDTTLPPQDITTASTTSQPMEALQEAGTSLPEEAVEETVTSLPEEALEETVTSLPVEALEETVTSLPEEALEETVPSLPEEETESSRWEKVPWVRFGLISGVLIPTAVVLCVLGALHKI